RCRTERLGQRWYDARRGAEVFVDFHLYDWRSGRLDRRRRRSDSDRCRRRRRCRRGSRSVPAEYANAIDQLVRRLAALAAIDDVAHAMQLVEARLQRVEYFGRRGNIARFHALHERLQLMAQIAHRANARHACAALERVHDTLELEHQRVVAAILFPRRQRVIGGLEQLGRFFAEDRCDFGVEIGAVVFFLDGLRRDCSHDRRNGRWRSDSDRRRLRSQRWTAIRVALFFREQIFYSELRYEFGLWLGLLLLLELLFECCRVDFDLDRRFLGQTFLDDDARLFLRRFVRERGEEIAFHQRLLHVRRVAVFQRLLDVGRLGIRQCLGTRGQVVTEHRRGP